MFEFFTKAAFDDWIRKHTKEENKRVFFTGADEAVRTARREGGKILCRLQQTARSLGIPENIIVADLPDFVSDFEFDANGQCRTTDGLYDPRTFLSQEQAKRSHWNEAAPPKNKNNDTTKSSSPSGSSNAGTQGAEVKPLTLAELFEPA